MAFTAIDKVHMLSNLKEMYFFRDLLQGRLLIKKPLNGKVDPLTKVIIDRGLAQWTDDPTSPKEKILKAIIFNSYEEGEFLSLIYEKENQDSFERSIKRN